MITSSKTYLKSKLARYGAALAAGSTAANAQTVTSFISPYEIPVDTNEEGASMEGTFGDWVGTFSGGGSANQIYSNINTLFTDPVSFLSFQFQHNFTLGATSYSFATVAAGTGDVEFNVSGAFSSGVFADGVFIRNGIEISDILINDDYSFAVTAGDSFGFKFTTDYSTLDGSTGNLGVYISNFSAAVPEVANFATWMGAGALGLISMRTARRRRRVQSVDAA